jgi:hypothetical protein
MRFATAGHRFGTGRFASILRLIFGTANSQTVYREDMIDIHSLSNVHELRHIKRPEAGSEGTGIGVDGTDISTETTADSRSPSSSAANPPSHRSPPPVSSGDRLQSSQSLSNGRHYLKYLPACFGSRETFRLSHIEVRIIDDSSENDETIFRRLRTVRNVRIGWLRRLFSCWCLRRIELVKVSPQHLFHC